MAERQYLMPVAYFERTPAEVRQLQKEAADLHATVDARVTSWVDRTRATERLKDVERQIQTSRMAHRQAEQLQADHVQCGEPVRLIRSDSGSSYLLVRNTENAKSEPQYMPVAEY